MWCQRCLNKKSKGENSNYARATVLIYCDAQGFFFLLFFNAIESIFFFDLIIF